MQFETIQQTLWGQEGGDCQVLGDAPLHHEDIFSVVPAVASRGRRGGTGSVKPLGEIHCWVRTGWIHPPSGRIPPHNWDIVGLSPLSQPKRAQGNPSPPKPSCVHGVFTTWFTSEPGSHPLVPCRTQEHWPWPPVPTTQPDIPGALSSLQ